MVWEDAVDEARGEGVGGVEAATPHEEVDGVGEGHEFGEKLGAAEGRGVEVVDEFGHVEVGVAGVGGDAAVAVEGELDAAAVAGAVDGGDGEEG